MEKALDTHYTIADDFQYPQEGMSSRVLLPFSEGKVTLFVSAQGAGLKIHKAADALTIIRQRKATTTLEGETFEAESGTSVLFKEGQWRSLQAKETFKIYSSN